MSEPQPSAATTFQRALLVIVLLAFGIRLFGIGWDSGHAYHPDERRIAEAVSQMSFRPLQLNPHFFAYGSLPMMVTRTVASLGALVHPWLGSYEGVIRVGRALSALWGAGAVWLVALLGRRLFGEGTGLLAAGLLAVTVSHIQNSHFATTDIPLTFLVLACLSSLVRLVDGGRLRHLVAAAALAGLALATKASAAPLLLPVAIAILVVAVRERRFVRAIGWGGLALGVVAACFAIGEPFAFVDHQWWHDVAEQAQMVRTAGNVPYTTQYIGTPHYLYELRELVLWGMGPLLGLAALWGWGWHLVRTFRRPSWGPILLLAWVVPFFLITGSFQVRFPRYLLPIYPLLVLYAAAWLEEVAARGRAAGRVVRGLVVGATAAYSLAFMAIYFRPHIQVTASQWFNQHVPSGSHVLSQDWDEGFPLPLPGAPSDRTKVVQFGFYEPDSPAKASRLARELANSDVIVLQTKRLYGAVTMAPQRYPITVRFFQLLFAGDLGFRLEAEFASRPSLFGIELPSELADESFSVYDHPKALIFTRTERLSAMELERRLLTATPPHPLTRTDLLLARSGSMPAPRPATAEPRLVRSSWAAAVLVLLWLELAGLVGWALLASHMAPRPGLFAAGHVFGVLAAVFPAWLAVNLKLVPLGRAVIVVGWLLVVGAAVELWRRRRIPALPVREALLVAALTSTAFVVIVALRAFNPEIYWGEKPMDSAFLRVLFRTDALPPPEPWLAGTSLSYTYFGHYVVAALGRGLGIDPAIMFNLGLGVAAALFAAGLVAGGCAVGDRLRAGLVSALAGVALGNLAGPWMLRTVGRINFDYFWATSRVIPNTINEYPAWNLVFADLHAHVLAMPWAALLFAVIVWLARRTGGRREPACLAVAGVAFAAVMMTNGWSTPSYVAVVAVLPLAVAVGRLHRPRRQPLLRTLGQAIFPAVTVISTGVLLALPFFLAFRGPDRSWGWERGPWAHPTDLLLVFGLQLAVLVPAGFALLNRLERARGTLRPASIARSAALGALLALTLFDLPPLLRFRLTPAHSSLAFAVVLVLLALRVTTARALPQRTRLAAAAAGLAAALVAGCELVFVWDRMNTLFKFYLDAWLILAPVAGFAAVELFSPATPRSPGRALRRIVAVAAAAIAVFTSVTGTTGALRGRHARGPIPTLDGTAFLPGTMPDDAAAVAWLNRNVSGTPTVVEAWGPSYQDFGRISMHTGLPTVLGWDYHVFQRGASWREINRRKAELELIYTSASRDLVAAALARHRAAWVVVGDLERRSYGVSCATSFPEWKDLVAPAFTAGKTTVWQVRGKGLPVIAATAEPEPAWGAAGPEQDPPGRLREPRGVAVAADGTIVVADFGNDRIQTFDASLRPLQAWGRRGSAPGEFNQPCAVAVGPDGLIYVADTWNGRVQVFDLKGTIKRHWAAEMYGPRGIAVARDGRVFVADTGNNRILRFAPDGSLEKSWGQKGSGPDGLAGPHGLAIDQRDRLWICDNDNARLVACTLDGAFLLAIPIDGWRRDTYSEPSVAATADGTIWVTVPLGNRVLVMTPEGQVRTTIVADHLGKPFDKVLGLAPQPDEDALVISSIEGGLRTIRNPYRPEPGRPPSPGPTAQAQRRRDPAVGR